MLLRVVSSVLMCLWPCGIRTPVVDVFAAELQKVAEQQQHQETGLEMEPPVPDQTTVRDQTTLVPNEAEAFALEPLDVTSLGKSLVA